MLKRVTTTLLLVVFVGGTALADAKLGGVARQLSLGGGGFRGIAVNPFIWDDPTQIYLNPAHGNKYKDYIWMNAGGGGLTGTTSNNDGYGLQNGGVNFSLGSNLSVGTILSHDPTLTNTVAGALAIGGVGINSGLTLAPVEVLQFFGAYALGSNTSLGVRLMYGWSSNDNIVSGGAAPGTNEYTASVIGLSAGITFELGSGSAIDGAVSFTSSSADDIGGLVTPPVSGEANGTEIGLTARGKLRINNKVNFIPVVAFASLSADGTNGAVAPTTADVSGTSIGIGVGMDLHVGDFYLVGGISYGSTSLETTTTTAPAPGTTSTNTTSGFPVIQIGGEWMFTDWLTGRLGYVRSFTTFSTESAPAPGTTTETNMFTGWSQVAVGGFNQDNLVVFGLAGSFGNFGFEATVSESALRRGFGIVGSSDNLNSFGYLTANYNFN